MQVITLLNQIGIQSPFPLGEELGSGCHGQVFCHCDDPGYAIKLSVIYGDDADLQYRRLCTTLHTLYLFGGRPTNHLPFVYDYKLLYQGLISSTKCIIHYHTMERFFGISEDEKKVFHTILSHEDANRIKSFDFHQLTEALTGLSKGLTFDIEKVRTFHRRIQRSFLEHRDMHPRNIMKDRDGDFKLIDLDSVVFKGSVR